jgi:predicted TPR repeat methyltransferase
MTAALKSTSDMYEDGDYHSNNPNWHMEDSPWKAAQALDIIQRNTVDFKTGVEVGCGAGLILQELEKSMPEKSWAGYDISPDATAFWTEYKDTKVSYYQDDFLETKIPADLVLLMDVFEHVEDYIGFLRTLRGKSTSFVFHIPLDMNISALLRDLQIVTREKVGHLHYFSKATALATLEDSGYTIIDHRYTTIAQRNDIQMSLKTKIVNILRAPLFAIAPDFTAKLFGGYSLIVLAQQAPSAP